MAYKAIATADGGNTKWKINVKNGRKFQNEAQFDHYFVSLSRADYDRVMKRDAAAASDMFIVNGKHYMIGRKAARYGRFELKVGELRYNPEYYGVLAAIALARGFCTSVDDIFWMGSHPPSDVDYADDLLASVVRPWEVHNNGKTMHFNVVDGTTFDEPVGGWANTVIRADGRGFLRRDIMKGTTLTVDVGGITTDVIVIDPNGEIDYTSAKSEHIGVLQAVDQFKSDFKAEHAAMLKGMVFDDEMVHEAIKTGQFNLRGLGVFPCEELATELRRYLASQVVNFYDRYGGASLYDTLLLTGGGSALIEAELRSMINHKNIVLAEKSKDMHMANARGGHRWCAFHMQIGTFEV